MLGVELVTIVATAGPEVVAGALASSGLLNRQIGGKSVFPYQPPGYWAALNFPTREWQKDAGEKVGKIPVPPKYQSKDFLKADFWRLRGGLDVPKERFVSFPGAERGADGSLVIAWAGWRPWWLWRQGCRRCR